VFNKILIANRGEIAVRILRACQEMRISTVAIYSSADQHALHVRMADEAVSIGPAPAAQSYLDITRILDAAKSSGADAIHPGYGFLAENDEFARAVEAAGMVFIGPPAGAIQAMGDKGEARRRVQAAGVRVVPGYQGADDEDSLLKAATGLEFPILIKAAAGGGGKGMRLVSNPDDLPDAISAARRESQNAFGDSRLILEKYISKARHVVFQVLADRHGNFVHLFERDCSIQRRYQKIIEETPSPQLDNELRSQMGADAVLAAQAAGYQNAGTVEFILDPRNHEYYFLEMNTRLQVEHAITEMVTGLDLVQWQIRIAAGEPFSYHQSDLNLRGHAIECRLYAEDPAHNFLPASGPLLRFIPPSGPGVRTDTGYTSGDQVTTYYDPLIAKLVAYGEDRSAAIRRMQTALRDTVVLGIPSNWQFLQDVLAHPDFQHGEVSTNWAERTFENWQPPSCPLPPEAILAAALIQEPLAGPQTDTEFGSPDSASPWRSRDGFRLGG
jgi:acetyl-CoA carboxylase biotin carboxylase subunit